MEAIFKQLGASRGPGLLRTRQGTLFVAGIVAVIAGLILFLFLDNYRKDTISSGPQNVLVAQRVIPKGTAGGIVASANLYVPTAVVKDSVQSGALTDAGALAGKVAVRDIYPGEQIKASDFVVGGDAIRGRLSGTQRAIAVPVDASHGLIGQIRAGDRVDVMVGFNTGGANTESGRSVVRTLVRDVLILGAPGSPGGAGGATATNLVIRVNDQQAAQVAFASDNGRIWFVMRAPAGASDSSRDNEADLESLISARSTGVGGEQ